jgi:VWFA-related protein
LVVVNAEVFLRRSGATLGTLILSTVAVAGVSAQQPGPQFYGEAYVNTVEVPVRVVDREGRPVTGLRIDDFEILEDGLPQTITNFREVHGAGPTAQGDDPSVRRYVIGPGIQKREVVYFFDLVLSEKEDKRRAVEGLRSLYSGGVPAGERISIVTFDGEPRPIVERSESFPEIMDGLAQVDKARAQGLMWRIHAEDPTDLTAGLDPSVRRQARRSISRPIRRQYYQELRQRVAMVMHGLSATMARYADGDARRAVVVFTPGLPRSSNWTGLDGSQDAEEDDSSNLRRGLWYATAMEASDLGFTLYFVDSSTARHMATTGVDKSPAIGSGLDNTSGSEDPRGDADEDGAFGFENIRRSVMGEAAYVTGGESLHFSNVERAVRKVADGLSHYYSLGYQPEHHGDGLQYQIKVRLPEHPQHRVIHRRAYVDRSIEQREEQYLRAQILFDAGTNLHGVSVELGEVSKRFKVGARGMKRIVVPVSVHVPFSDFTMVEQGPGFAGLATFAFMVEDKAGNTSAVINHEMAVNVPKEQAAAALDLGYFTFVTELETDGGKKTLHVAVTDVLAQRTSVVSLDVKF